MAWIFSKQSIVSVTGLIKTELLLRDNLGRREEAELVEKSNIRDQIMNDNRSDMMRN